MPDIFTLESKIKQMIDEMKGLCQTNGLSNQAGEEVVITSVFLYKFLNDKFMANMKDFAKEMDMGTKKSYRMRICLQAFMIPIRRTWLLSMKIQ